MTKKNQKRKRKPIYKNLGFYSLLFYALLTIGIIVQIFTVNMIPAKYTLTITAVLALLLLAMGYLQLGKRVNKVNKMLGKLLIVLLACILGMGNWYLYKTGSAVSRMTGDQKQTYAVSFQLS